jgi:glycosyltransferase involved in cell wall biosynthesis
VLPAVAALPRRGRHATTLIEAPLVTVLITCYNYGDYVGEAIESALSQTYERVEVVVVDDGSRDHSRDVIGSYGDRVTAVYKENGGQASGWNAGFVRGRGSIVQFLDADDILLPDTIERVVRAFRAHPDAALVQFRLEVADQSGRPLGMILPPLHVRLPDGDLRVDPRNWTNNSWWAPVGSAAAVTSGVLKHVFPLPEDVYRIAADHGLARASALCGPVVSLDEVGGYYRSHSTNHSYNVGAIDIEKMDVDLRVAIASHAYLREFAARVGVAGYIAEPDRLLDTLTQRLLLLKLGNTATGLPGDRLPKVAWRGVQAAWRRRDVGRSVRLVHAGWFMAIAVLPRFAAWWLADHSVVRQNPRSLPAVLGAILSRSRIRRGASTSALARRGA